MFCTQDTPPLHQICKFLSDCDNFLELIYICILRHASLFCSFSGKAIGLLCDCNIALRVNMTVKLDNVVNNLFQERTRWSQRKREPKRSSFYKTAAKRRNKGLSSDDSSEENDPDDSNDPDGNEKEKKKKKSGAEDEKEDDSDDETSSDAYENILEASMEDLKQVGVIRVLQVRLLEHINWRNSFFCFVV